MARDTFAWKPEYSVNVQIIDAQHKAFIGILNDLYQSIMNKDPKTTLTNTINQLVSYAKLHFTTEEKYFDEFNFEGSAEHKEAHAVLLAQVEMLVEKKEKTNDPVGLIFEILDFLEVWLVDHLATMDKKYVECFNKHGLK